MNEVFEALMFNEPVHEALVAQHLMATDFSDALETRRSGADLDRAPRRWSSSLCDSDLQCLLQVIEAELIPQLISGYSPARCSPKVSPVAPD